MTFPFYTFSFAHQSIILWKCVFLLKIKTQMKCDFVSANCDDISHNLTLNLRIELNLIVVNFQSDHMTFWPDHVIFLLPLYTSQCGFISNFRFYLTLSFLFYNEVISRCSYTQNIFSVEMLLLYVVNILRPWGGTPTSFSMYKASFSKQKEWY